jgi:peptide deformylase
MTVRRVIAYPDPALRRESALVESFDRGLRILVDDLFDTLHESGGIGLCAPQIGDHRQVLVMNVPGTTGLPKLFVNPRIRLTGQACMVEESCLSVPGVVGNVRRVNGVSVKAQDITGASFEVGLDNLAAVCLQHEMDHLAGTLFIDRLPFHRRLAVRATTAWRQRRAAAAASARPGAA